jgi:hypothetical protein
VAGGIEIGNRSVVIEMEYNEFIKIWERIITLLKKDTNDANDGK